MSISLPYLSQCYERHGRQLEHVWHRCRDLLLLLLLLTEHQEAVTPMSRAFSRFGSTPLEQDVEPSKTERPRDGVAC